MLFHMGFDVLTAVLLAGWGLVKCYTVSIGRHFKAQEYLNNQGHAVQENSSLSQNIYQLHVLTL